MYKISFFILILVTLMSCSKEKNETNLTLDQDQEMLSHDSPEEAVVVYTNYYLDGIEVEEDAIDFNNEKQKIGIKSDPVENSTVKKIVSIYAFSSDELYIRWGEENNFPVALKLEMEKHLSNYALESGAINYYEETGEILPLYAEYETAYLERTSENHSSSRSLMWVMDLCGGGTSHFIANHTPIMPWLNNQVSSYYPMILASGTTFYDRTFYRSSMATLWRTGYMEYCFEGTLSFLDNRSSSISSFP